MFQIRATFDKKIKKKKKKKEERKKEFSKQ